MAVRPFCEGSGQPYDKKAGQRFSHGLTSNLLGVCPVCRELFHKSKNGLMFKHKTKLKPEEKANANDANLVKS